MNQFSKNLNYAFVGGLIGLAIATFLAPKAITQLFSPPVDFGVTCGPAGAWSMQKLIICQAMGLLFGIFITFWIKFKFSGGKSTPKSDSCCS